MGNSASKWWDNYIEQYSIDYYVRTHEKQWAKNERKKDALEREVRNKSCFSCREKVGPVSGSKCDVCSMVYCSCCSVKKKREGEEGKKKKKASWCKECDEMESNGFQPFERDFEKIMKLSPDRVQPIPEEDSGTFRGGRYYMMKSKGEVRIHRIVDKSSNKAGCFWMITPPSHVEGSMLSERMGFAIKPEWNKMEAVTYAVLPPGVVIYGGYAAPQSDNKISLPGGSFQCYIPRNVAEVLFSGQGHSDFIFNRAQELQKQNLDNFLKKMKIGLEKRAQSREFILDKLRNNAEVPSSVMKLVEKGELPRGGYFSDYYRVSEGTWNLHQEEEMPGVLVEIKITIEFVRTTEEIRGGVRYVIHWYKITVFVLINT